MVSECLSAKDMPTSVRLLASEALRLFASAHGERPSALDTVPTHFDGGGETSNSRDVPESNPGPGAALAGLGAVVKPPPPRKFARNQELFRRGGCVPLVLSGLATANGVGDDQLQLAVVRVLLEASYSADNARALAEGGLFSGLAPLLRTDFRSPIVFHASELMWNVLESVRDSPGGRLETATGTGSKGFCAAFSQLVATTLREGHRKSDKELRNDLLITARMLAEDGRARASLRVAGLGEVARHVAVHPELGASSTTGLNRLEDGVVHPLANTTSAQDFEMKRLAWELLATLADDEAGVALARGQFVACLLTFVQPLTGASASVEGAGSRWTGQQLRDLQAQALRLLARLAPLCVDELTAQGAGETAVAVASPDSPADDDQRAAALDLLITMTHADEAAAERLGAAGAVETALHCLEGADAPRPVARSTTFSLDASMYGAVVTAEPGDDTGLDEGHIGELGESINNTRVGIHPATSEDPVKLAAASLLAALCDGWGGNRKILRRADGVAILRSHVDAVTATDRAVPIALSAAVIYATWRCLVPCTKNCAHFVAGGGLAQLLNLLLACTPTLRPVVVSTLADILENPKTHLFFHEWRSTGGRHALVPAGGQGITLMLNLWRAEEGKMGTTRHDGTLVNPENPLRGSAEFVKPDDGGLVTTYSTLTIERSATEEAAAKAAKRDADHMMSRVFAVCSLLGFDNLRAYCSPADALTLTIVERYVDFREGEMWEETEEMFREEGMRPVAADRQHMEASIAEVRESALELRDVQREMLAAEEEKARRLEAEFYEQMRMQKEREEAHRWYRRDMSKLTMKERLTARLAKADIIDGSFRGHSSQFLTVHSRDLDVTGGSEEHHARTLEPMTVRLEPA